MPNTAKGKAINRQAWEIIIGAQSATEQNKNRVTFALTAAQI